MASSDLGRALAKRGALVISLSRMLKAIRRRINRAHSPGARQPETRLHRYRCVLNVNLDLASEQPRALLVYVPTIFHTTQSARRIVHTNVLESAQIVRELVKRNFCVDVFDCNRPAAELLDLLSGKSYDLMLGLGDAFEAACERFKDAIAVLYVTENHPELSLRNELERIERFTGAYGRSARLERTNTYFTRDSIAKHDRCIVLGDLSSFEQVAAKKYSLCPTGFGNPSYGNRVGDFGAAKRSFVWMGTNAPIHKGLDVLIEAFSGLPSLTLHVVGMTREQLREYGLCPSANVVVHGFMNIASSDFMDIANSSCFMILPSCSEAMSTSILTGMRHGLIPMVLSGVGMDGIPSGLRITLDGFLPEVLRRHIEESAALDIQWLQHLRGMVFEYANHQYTIERYSRDLGSILDEIIAGEPAMTKIHPIGETTGKC